MPSDQPRKGQLCTCDRLPGQHLTTDCVPDSERAITTAAREAMIEAAGRAMLLVGRIRFGGEESEPVTWTEFEDFLLPRERRMAAAALDAVRPLVVREEYDRLRNDRTAIEKAAIVGLASIATRYSLPPSEAIQMFRVGLLALLGESTQEQASE